MNRVHTAPGSCVFRDLFPGANGFASQNAIVSASGLATWQELSDQAESVAAHLNHLRARRVGLCFRSIPESFSVLAALDSLAADAFLLDGDMVEAALHQVAERFGLSAVLVPGPTAGGSLLQREFAFDGKSGTGSSTVSILTSGTTGAPKAARHTWSSLSRPVRRIQDQRGARWLLTYRPNLYAGLQVILQCLVNQGTLVLAELGTRATTVAALMKKERVEYVSATPSYWRQFLLQVPPADLADFPLKQITLGGEAVDQAILDRIMQLFPAARVVHIYATTELGRCFSVSDGKAGFPASLLEGVSRDAVALKIDDGELLVRSANAMQSYDRLSGTEASAPSDWFRTGDLVEQREDRVYFVGRKSDIINVGGNKVNPTEVEQIIRELPGIIDLLVYRKSSSVTGELVACDLVLAPGVEASAVKKALGLHCASRLTAYQRPRFVRVVDAIQLSRSGKKKRTEA